MELSLVKAHVTQRETSEQPRQENENRYEASKDDELDVVLLSSLGDRVHSHGGGSVGLAASKYLVNEFRHIMDY